jgi:hypothetical protein
MSWSTRTIRPLSQLHYKRVKFSLRPINPSTDRLMTVADLRHDNTKQTKEDNSSRNASELYLGNSGSNLGRGTDYPCKCSSLGFSSNSLQKNNTVFWGISACTPLKVNIRFGGEWDLHLQGRKMIKARNERNNQECWNSTWTQVTIATFHFIYNSFF